LPYRVLFWVHGASILLLLLAYMTPYVPVRQWGWLSLLALAYPFLLLANFAFALTWFVIGKWQAWLSLAVLLLGWPVHARYFKLFAWPAGKVCDAPMTCVSYNVRGFSLVQAEGDMPVKADTLKRAFARRHVSPDILCLQEAVKADAIGKSFGLKQVYHAPKSTLWLFTRYPIRKKGTIDGAEISPCALWADLETPSGMVRVYNIHLVSNRVTNTTRELLDDIQDRDGNRWGNIKFIVSRYRRTTTERADEATRLREHVAASPYPVVITGDANDTPISNTFRILSNGLHDSFRERGAGLATTYRSLYPLLRIDYALGSPGIRFTRHETPGLSHSDHSPVVARFCLASPEGP